MSSRAGRLYVLATDIAAEYGAAITGETTTSAEERLLALARAVAGSPLGSGLSDAVLVVRTDPAPVLALIGEFDAADEVWIQMLRWQIEHVLPAIRYITYAQAERDCEQLAAQLIDCFGRQELHRFRYVGIPRGGYIVLGMLAYALGLSHSQLAPSGSGASQDAPVVIVDDCALSGRRLGRFLSSVAGDTVIFAHLYSHPALRQAILDREPKVIACVTAHDLVDLAPARLGDGCDTWRARWRARDGDATYWVGQPEHVCFAWNEPDIALWNSVLEREERGWRLIPPDLCLKHRALGQVAGLPIQHQPVAKGPLKPADHVLYGEINDQIVVGNIQSGDVLSLDGVAADLWQAIVRYGQCNRAIEELARVYDVEETILRADVQTVLAELMDCALLEKEVSHVTNRSRQTIDR